MKKSIELCNFIDLTLDEKEMILSWRNNPITKKWMYSQENITLENHLNFINNLNNQKDKLYFLIKNNKEYIGVIDFTNITDDSVHMGIYSNPTIKGIGKILLDEIISYSFNVLMVQKIYAEVFLANNKAYSFYKQNDFIEINKRVVNNKEVICMELKNENR